MKTDNKMWDERYNTEDYAYGITPNKFLAENYGSLPKGKILSLAEGEGRNAVFLAKQGYAVTAIDSSSVGLEKAKKLAEKNHVIIVSIFCPLSSLAREKLHKKIMAGLKKKGVFLLEAYTPEQLKHGTGGGNSEDMMTSKISLINELKNLEFNHLLELEREVIEGAYHTGVGAVVQAIATK